MAVAMKAATKSGRSAAAAAGVALTCSANKTIENNNIFVTSGLG